MVYKILKWAVWLLPIYLTYQMGYQATVLFSMQDTYNTGADLVAQVTDFRIKHIASQTNGYVDLRFTDPDGELIEQRLSLPVQLAAPIQSSAQIPIKYKAENSQDIVMTPTYSFHQNMVIVNIGVLALSVFVTFLISLWGYRVAVRRISDPEQPLFIRTDVNPSS
jgi:hypothetical protein